MGELPDHEVGKEGAQRVNHEGVGEAPLLCRLSRQLRTRASPSNLAPSLPRNGWHGQETPRRGSRPRLQVPPLIRGRAASETFRYTQSTHPPRRAHLRRHR
jgi:hypothetical protein